jgi:hypothetical protein
MELVGIGQTGWTDNNRTVHLLRSYLFDYQDAFQIQIFELFELFELFE